MVVPTLNKHLFSMRKRGQESTSDEVIGPITVQRKRDESQSRRRRKSRVFVLKKRTEDIKEKKKIKRKIKRKNKETCFQKEKKTDFDRTCLQYFRKFGEWWNEDVRDSCKFLYPCIMSSLYSSSFWLGVKTLHV